LEEEDFDEELYAEPTLEEEPVNHLEKRHEDGEIDSVELGFSKGYEEDKDYTREKASKEDEDNIEDPFTDEDFDI